MTKQLLSTTLNSKYLRTHPLHKQFVCVTLPNIRPLCNQCDIVICAKQTAHVGHVSAIGGSHWGGNNRKIVHSYPWSFQLLSNKKNTDDGENGKEILLGINSIDNAT